MKENRLRYCEVSINPTQSFIYILLFVHVFLLYVILLQVSKLISSVLAARPLRRFGQNQRYSDYIMFLLTRAMSTLQDSTVVNLKPISDKARIENNGDNNAFENDDENIHSLGSLPSIAVPKGAASDLCVALSR